MTLLRRTELLELTPQALTAFSNAGFVKRSQKELAAGHRPELSQDATGTLTAIFPDGTRTRLATGQTLKEAECNCSANGMCRHRIMLVLSYQQACADEKATTAEIAPTTEPEATSSSSRWQPGNWLPELGKLPAATQKRAQMLASKGLVIELNCAPGQVPAARLPMSDVRFFSRNSVQFARCDCAEGSLCEHIILAVQAFAEAENRHPGFEHIIWQIQSRHTEQQDDPFATSESKRCRQSVMQLSHMLWHGGISQPAIAFNSQLAQAQRSAEATQWRWMSRALQQTEEGISQFQNRASHYRAAQFLTRFAGLTSRLRGAKQMAQIASEGETPMQPWRNIVGLGVEGEVKLDHLRLVSLGMISWQDSHLYGLRIWFADPDTGAVLHLSRQWPLSEQNNAPARKRRIATFPAHVLAGGQVISQSARRNASGELRLETRGRLNSVVPLTATAWEMPELPLCQPGVAALKHYLRQRLPAFVRPLNQNDNLFILPVRTCTGIYWDAARQTLDAEVISGDTPDNRLQLSLPVQPGAPHAVDLLVMLLQQQDDPPCKISGLVSLTGGRLTLEPLAVMTRQRAWMLHADPCPQQVLPTTSLTTPASVALTCLHQCQEMLIEWLHNGLSYQQQRLLSEATTQADALSVCGFGALARLLRQLHSQLAGTDSDQLTETLNAIVLLRDELEQHCLLADSEQACPQPATGTSISVS